MVTSLNVGYTSVSESHIKKLMIRVNGYYNIVKPKVIGLRIWVE